jgi:bifunctional UDP-N-acetylglucosamine pyrophosphorylase/glucosamine-1-phosphate N-acetyltransferase
MYHMRFMKAVVLAAGEGKRLRPLTLAMPKPMIPLNGRPLIEYVLDELPDEVTEIVMIVGYKAEVIRAHLGDAYHGRHITYITQTERKGTAHAVGLAKSYLDGKFMLLNGDDIGDKASFEKGLAYDYCIFVAEHDEPQRFGVVELNGDGTLKKFTEKPEKPATNLVSTGTMVLSPEVLSVPLVQHPNGECYIVDSVSKIMETKPVQVLRQASWITLTFPEDVAVVEGLLKKRGE